MADNTGTATRWHHEIEAYEREFLQWKNACVAINKLYRRENSASKFSILWANIQTLQPAVYARIPQAVVSRRFKDSDPVARTAIEVLERGVNYTLDAYDFDQVMRQGRDDYLLYARASAWLRYEPTMRTVPLEDAQTGDDPYQTDDLEEDGEPKEDETEPSTYEEIDFERVCVDYVHRDDFGHSVSRTWGEVWAVWRKVYLTRDELVDRFAGEDKAGNVLGKKIPLDHTPKGVASDADPETRERTCKATIYEIWSKRDRKVYFVAKDYPDILEEVEPFLKLASFWPCPKPAYGTLINDSLIPTPDYKYYEEQATEINTLTAKIAILEKSLKLAGFYPSGPSQDGADAIRQAMSTKELEVTLVPVQGWAAFAEKGGANQIVWIPLGQVIEALRACIELREQLIGDIYQITGISDIVRGDTNPNETATAQGLKSQWGSIRIRDRQMELARFANDIMTIASEIIAEKFQPQTLEQMTGVDLLPPEGLEQAQMFIAQSQAMAPQLQQRAQMGDEQAIQMLQQGQQQLQEAQKLVEQAQQREAVLALLRDDAQRGFRVEVESDSTIEPDEQMQKQAATELMSVMGGFLQQSLPVVQAFPPVADLLGQTALFVLRRYRAGRELEGTLEQLVDQLKQLGAPDPQAGQQAAQQAAEQEAQAKQAEQASKAQAAQAQSEAKVMNAQADMQKTQIDLQSHIIKNQSDIERIQAEAAARNIQQPIQ